MRPDGWASPEAVFAEAQSAMERGNWEEFFPCLDRRDLLRIAENSANGLLNRGEDGFAVLADLAAEHSFPAEALEKLRSRFRSMAETAETMARERAARGPVPPDGALMDISREYVDLVKDYQKTLKAGLKSVPDLPGFTAALERAMRKVVGGGSVSSKLFAGEVLKEVSVEGNKAWAVRRLPGGRMTEVGFVKRKGSWYIRLVAKNRNRRGSGN